MLCFCVQKTDTELDPTNDVVEPGTESETHSDRNADSESESDSDDEADQTDYETDYEAEPESDTEDEAETVEQLQSMLDQLKSRSCKSKEMQKRGMSSEEFNALTTAVFVNGSGKVILFYERKGTEPGKKQINILHGMYCETKDCKKVCGRTGSMACAIVRRHVQSLKCKACQKREKRNGKEKKNCVQCQRPDDTGAVKMVLHFAVTEGKTTTRFGQEPRLVSPCSVLYRYRDNLCDTMNLWMLSHAIICVPRALNAHT